MSQSNESIAFHKHFRIMCPMSFSGRESHVKKHELLEENLTMEQFLSEFDQVEQPIVKAMVPIVHLA